MSTHRPRNSIVNLSVGSVDVEATIDRYSDRVRCDHEDIADGRGLGHALRAAALEHGCGRIVVLAREAVAPGLAEVGYEVEATVDGFYDGRTPCMVMGAYPDPDRRRLASPERVAQVGRVLRDRAGPGKPHPDVETRRAGNDDAEGLARLLGDTFDEYPTPSDNPAYLRRAIEDGVPYRVVEVSGEIVACASADLVREARTAELTDCASRPEHRGSGFMQALLRDLMEDLRKMGYPTAFTIARAGIVGMNLAFQRLGFSLAGTMPQSCRIGSGIEDMNIWSRRLTTEEARVRRPRAL